MDAEKANYDVSRMARLLDVSRSGFYDWASRRAAGPTRAQQRREQLVEKIKTFHKESDEVYGSPRILADLREDGETVSAKTVAKLMRANNIRGISPRKWTPVTTVAGVDQAPCPDRVNRAFDTGVLNAVWVSDITYLDTDEGWLYLCAVRDGHSRRVLGWAVEDHMRADLVESALTRAVTLRGELPGQVIFHADRGTQYTSAQIADAAADLGVLRSMGRTGVCWDNAAAESFFSSLKNEMYHRYRFTTRARARFAVAEYIEVFYNRTRLHSSLGYRTPAAELADHHAAAAA
jgi:transposase InsO family protein